MLTRQLALLCAFCALGFATATSAETVDRLSLSNLAAGSRFEIITTDHAYRAELIDPATGESRLAASEDGVRFTDPRTVYLLGATQGRAAEAGGLMLVKMNQLQTGMRVELGFGSMDERDRRLTEPVRAIRVE